MNDFDDSSRLSSRPRSAATALDPGLAEVLDILRRGAAADYIGEPVSQLEHMLQGAHLAEQAKATDDEILGVLLHDIGHLCAGPDAPDMAGLGVVDHERIGADFLRARGFSATVCHLVEGHVQAKRYLVAQRASYAHQLSAASTGTLAFQGGPMTANEAARFERDPLFASLLRVRSWDERAKDAGRSVPGLDHYQPLLERHLTAVARAQAALRQRGLDLLDEPARQSWRDNGFVVLRGLYRERAAELVEFTDELCSWPETPGKWMKWFEATERDPRMLCRIEDFLPYHRGFRELLQGPLITAILSELMGEEATLYKEKVNLKLPGGAGFGAHQDAPAFTTFGQTYHITLAISIDASDEQNGCLELVHGSHQRGLLRQEAGGTIHPDVVQSLDWQPLRTQPGDVVLFDSYVPHRSGPNRSERPRRSLYVTYARKSEGDFRADYFRDKRAAFPPECERVAGADYSAAADLYNLGNPIR